MDDALRVEDAKIYRNLYRPTEPAGKPTSQMFSSPVCYLREEDIMGTESPLRIGYVPEHFSTPIHFAQQRFGLGADLVAFPSGTGHMITALRAGEIDVGIGLTEGWIAGLGKGDVAGDGGYKLVGTFVETPLCEQPLLPFVTPPGRAVRIEGRATSR